MAVFTGRFYGIRTVRKGERKGQTVLMFADIISDNVMVDCGVEVLRPSDAYQMGRLPVGEWVSWQAKNLNDLPQNMKRLGVDTPVEIQNIIDAYQPPRDGTYGVMDIFVGKDVEPFDAPEEPEPSSDAMSFFMGTYKPDPHGFIPKRFRERVPKPGELCGIMDVFTSGAVR